MPIIPRYEARVGLTSQAPSVRANPSVAGMQGQALSQLGETVSSAGETIQKHYEQMKKQDELRNQLKAVTDFESKWRLFVADERGKTKDDALGSVDRAEKFIQDSTDQYFKNENLSPEGRLSLQTQFRNVTATDLDGLARHQAEQRKDLNVSVLNTSVEENKKDAFMFPGKASELYGRAKARIDSAVSSGMFDQTTGTELKTKAKNEIYGSAIAGLVETNPGSAKDILPQYGDVLSEEQIASYSSQIRTRLQQLERDKAWREDRAEAQAKDALKKMQQENGTNLWILNFNNQLNDVDLDRMAFNRQIDESTYIALRKDRRSEKLEVKDNPFIVADIAEKVANHQDVADDLLTAVNNGQMKPETFKTYYNATKKDAYEDGAAYVSRAMKPSQFEQYNPDLHLRFAEAMDRYNMLVSKDTKPIDAAKQVVREYRDELIRTQSGIPRPTYLSGEKTDNASLLDAKEKTVAAYNKQAITPEEYQYQIGIINQLLNMAQIAEQFSNKNLDSDVRSRVEK